MNIVDLKKSLFWRGEILAQQLGSLPLANAWLKMSQGISESVLVLSM